MNLAYLLIAYGNIEQVFKLIHRLDNYNTYFFIHFKGGHTIKVPDNYKNKKNIILTPNRYKAGWGGFKVVLATLDLLKLAYYSNIKFDYFLNLSKDCYPVKSNRDIELFFTNNYGYSFIEGMEIPNSKIQGGGTYKIELPWFLDELQNINPYLKKLIHLLIHIPYKLFGIKREIPCNLKPFFGSQWWALNDKVVKYILDFTDKNKKVLNFFKHCWAPDELYIQTIVYNNDDLKNFIKNKPFRYLDWNTNGPPKTLTIEDYEKIKKSGELFARKFDYEISKELIEKLDSENKQ